MTHRMMRTSIVTTLIVCVLMGQTVIADVWQDIAEYNYGDQANPCEQAEKLLQDTPVGQYRAIEDKLIAVVASESATSDGKGIACRFLQQVGTEKCVPAVSGLLGDEMLSHYARLVLERLQCEAADKAMRDALAKVPDAAKVGILGSLGARRDRKVIDAVAGLAGSGNAAVAATAVETLGKIGGPDAARRLTSISPSKDLQPVQMKAMVACAASLSGSEAVALCETVLASSDTSARIAAMRQLAVVDPKKASPILAQAIQGDDARIRQGALSVVAGTQDRGLTGDMVKLLEVLPDGRTAELIAALGTRGDEAALTSVRGYVGNTDGAIARAAVKAVGKLGDARDVPLLLGAADSLEISETVTRALVEMGGDGIDLALVKALDDDDLSTAAIKACAARGCMGAVPGLLKLAEDPDSNVRKEAWSGLGVLAGDGDVKAIVAVVMNMKDKSDIRRAEGAIKSTLSRSGDRSTCFEAVAARYGQADEATKVMILEVGAAVGDAKALELHQDALKAANSRVAAAAVRSLASWPNASAAEDLLELAQNASEVTDRLVALRGYIHIAGLEAARLATGKRVNMLEKAMEVATRPEEKKLVIGTLQNVKSIESLRMLGQYLDDTLLESEVEASAANLLWDLRDKYREEVTAIARKLMTSKSQNVTDKAKRVLDDLDKNK